MPTMFCVRNVNMTVVYPSCGTYEEAYGYAKEMSKINYDKTHDSFNSRLYVYKVMPCGERLAATCNGLPTPATKIAHKRFCRH